MKVETLTLKESDIIRLNVWERTMRETYGLLIEYGNQSVRKNQEIYELYNNLDIVADIKRKRLELEWLEHLIKIDKNMVVKKVF